jgi:aspartate aminotransferase
MEVSKRIFELETETAFAILAKANNLSSKGMDIINLGIGQPDFPTPQNIQEAAIKAIKDGKHGYTPSNGLPELRDAVAEKILKDYDVLINSENILITPGGKPVIFISALIFGGPDKEIIYPDPGFPIYRSMIKFSGAKPVPLFLDEEDNFEINFDKLKNLITAKTSLIIINNPNNPTGSFMDQNKIDKLINILEEYPNLHILSDEIYSKIIFDNNTMPTLLKYKNLNNRLIVLDGWSKTYCMTGWRLGWSVWPSSYIEYANKLCVNNHSCPSSISQYAGIEAIKGPQEELTKIVNEFQKRKEFIYKEINKLNKISCFNPGGAFYAFPNISKTGLSGKEFADIALEKKGVALVPGTSFGNNAEKYVRISFANSLEKIEEAIKRISTI